MWFRSDLRIDDNTALYQACRSAEDGVMGVFLVSPRQWREHDWGAARVDFVLRSAGALAGTLAKGGIVLRVVEAHRFEEAPAALLELARRSGCASLYFNREYEVNERRRDDAVIRRFEAAGLAVRAFDDQCVIPPGCVRTGSGGYYQVYTPFRRAWLAAAAARDVAPLEESPRPRRRLDSACDAPPAVAEMFADPSLPSPPWPAGEEAARRRLDAFIAGGLQRYHERRDVPAVAGTSALSPYLAVGALSARRCLAAARAANGGRLHGGTKAADTWITQLAWREFYRHVLVGFPRVSRGRAFRARTERLRWNRDEAAFRRWCEGRTGVPIVDAGMRQLAATGWMHNRLRMIVAMYLTKDLFIDWRRGERHFMQHLVDGDLANNNGGWQWAASTGTDAVPYFRVFNPWTQGRRFDPQGEFTRRWCPELASLDGPTLHDPRRFAAALGEGIDYPLPLVDHRGVRERVVARFRMLDE